MRDEKELKDLGWDIYRCNNWRALNRETGKKITAGTFYTLIHLVNYEEDIKYEPWRKMFI